MVAQPSQIGSALDGTDKKVNQLCISSVSTRSNHKSIGFVGSLSTIQIHLYILLLLVETPIERDHGEDCPWHSAVTAFHFELASGFSGDSGAGPFGNQIPRVLIGGLGVGIVGSACCGRHYFSQFLGRRTRSWWNLWCLGELQHHQSSCVAPSGAQYSSRRRFFPHVLSIYSIELVLAKCTPKSSS